MSNRGRAAKSRRARRQGNQSSAIRGWLLWGSLVLAALVIVGVVAALQRGKTFGGGTPDFHMVTYQGQDVLGGKELDFAQLFGLQRTKPVVLNFGAGRCPPCRAEMPGYERVYEDLGDRFTLVGVDVGPYTGLGSHEDARKLLQQLHITYPAAYATDDPTSSYRVQAMPTTVFLTPSGKIFDRHTGYLPEDQLRSGLQDLLTASS